jgi:hypothetical protein
VRADLIGDTEAPKVKALLVQYLGQRIASYETSDGRELDIINRKTADLEEQLWARADIDSPRAGFIRVE